MTTGDDTDNALTDRLRRELEERRNAEQSLRDTNIRLSDALVEIREVQGRLIRQERLNALNEMASGIAHDFNNALMPIVGLTDFLLDNPETWDDREELRDTLQEIRGAAEDARHAVMRLRSFYKEDSGGVPQEGLLQNAIIDAVETTRPLWQEQKSACGIVISVDVQSLDIPSLLMHADEVREVFVNLIRNSVDAMPDGGRIRISGQVQDDAALIDVTDTGEGMEEETHRHCFDPFFSTRGGSGIGLAMVYGVMRRHRGGVEISSTPGQGTTVQLRFPLRSTAENPGQSPEAPASLRILVVDDDPRSRNVLSKFLRADGHHPVTESSGAGACARLEAEPYDMLLTDRALKDMSGDSVAEKAAAQAAQMPVIMLTGFGELMKESGVLPPGVDVLLSKPITSKELRAAISDAFRRHRKPD